MAGRRWGKTTFEQVLLSDHGVTHPKTKSWLILPTYGQAKEIYRDMIGSEGFQAIIRGNSQQPYPSATFVNGHFLGFRSFERPNTLRGGALTLAAIDEASDIDEAEVWRVVWPKLSDLRGTLFITGTLKGESGWLWQMYLKGQETGSHIKSWLFPTSRGIRYQGEDGERQLALDRATVPDQVWKQEYLCMPEASSAAAFAFLDRAINKGRVVPCRERAKAYVMGWDVGKIEDPSVFVVLDVETGEVVHYETQKLGTDWPKQLDRAADLCQHYGATCVIDSTGRGDTIFDFAKLKIPNIHGEVFSRNNKTDFVNLLRWEIETYKLQIPGQWHDLIQQLREYTYRYVGRNIEYSAPEGKHDDGVCALMLAVLGRKRKWYLNQTSMELAPPPGSQGDAFRRQRAPKDEGGKL